MKVRRIHLSSAGFLVLMIMFSSRWAPAQIDLSADWSNKMHEDQVWRIPGAELGEYEGIPLSAAGRRRAESWDASINTLPEKQCNPLPADDFTDFVDMRIWKEVDPVTQQVIAWHQYTNWGAQERIIWMDGRPHPSEWAPHTWAGFSTGKWEGNQLTITTTHLKTGLYERVGEYASDLRTLREHWIRRDDHLMVMLFIDDPVYLTEPFVRTRDYVVNPAARGNPYSCTPTAEIANRPEGYVPHYLPGKNPYLLNAKTKWGVPESAIGGGAETTYPDFLAKLKDPTVQPLDLRLPRVPASAVEPDLDKVQITVVPVQGNVYMLAGTGGNITVQVGEYSVIVVDSQFAPLSEKILAAIRQISNKPIRYVVNTSFDPDHTGGNAEIAKAGSQVSGQRFIGEGDRAPAAIVAHENTFRRMSAPTGQKSSVPFAAWPTETYATPEYELFNGEGVQIIHLPSAHTDGDNVAFFRRSDVVSTGDVFSTTSYPVIDRKNGGSITGEIAALNRLIKLSIPRHMQEGGTYLIPGHGRISDEADVIEYRDMVTIIRDRIQDLIKQGMTLEQVKAARPTLDYDDRYATARWTGDMFIEAIYADLSGAKTN